MRSETRIVIASRSTATFVVEPPEAIIPVEISVDAYEAEPFPGVRGSPMAARTWRAKLGAAGEARTVDLLILDVKVGKDSQVSSTGSFSTGLLPAMKLRLDECLKGMFISGVLYNPHDESVMTTFAVVGGGKRGDPTSLMMPFEGEDLPLGGTGKFVSWSQVGGKVSELVLSKSFELGDVVGVSTRRMSGKMKFDLPKVCELGAQVRERNAAALSGANEITPGGRLIVEVKNTSDRIMRCADLAAVLVTPKRTTP